LSRVVSEECFRRARRSPSGESPSAQALSDAACSLEIATPLNRAEFAAAERIKLKIEGSFTNIFNHVNLNDPQLQIDAPSFGQITSARFGFGGYRTGQVSMRVLF
jgi:hypothetical protein